VRINPQGDAVMAGRAAPGAEVSIARGGMEIGRVQADEQGAWVFVPLTPLPPGGQELTLSEHEQAGRDIKGDGSVLLDSTLSREAIRLEDGHLSLNPEVVWTDVQAFEQALEIREDDARRLRALELYRGNFLPSDSDAPWTVSIRERLRGKFIYHVSHVGRRLEQEGRWDSAIVWYLRGLDADNLTEEFYQGLIRCHAAEGRPAEAMSVFRRLRQTLSVTLGLKPSAATEALVRQLHPA
jgi:pentatricopeptide repeat protein